MRVRTSDKVEAVKSKGTVELRCWRKETTLAAVSAKSGPIVGGIRDRAWYISLRHNHEVSLMTGWAGVLESLERKLNGPRRYVFGHVKQSSSLNFP